jgi:hypothetical protein
MESNFTYTFSDLYKDVLSYQGQNRDETDATLVATAKRRVNEAYRKFLGYDWAFLSQFEVLKVDAGQYEYTMPDNFSILRSSFKLFPFMGWANPQEIPVGKFWSFQSFYPRTGIPLYFTFKSEFSPTSGLRYKVLFYPTPHIGLTYNYEFKILPNAMVNDADIPYCPANLSHVLRAFCLSEVEQFDEEGTKTAWTTILYNVMMPQAMKENSIRSDKTVGNMCIGGSPYTIGNFPTLHPIFGNMLSIGGNTYSV